MLFYLAAREVGIDILNFYFTHGSVDNYIPFMGNDKHLTLAGKAEERRNERKERFEYFPKALKISEKQLRVEEYLTAWSTLGFALQDAIYGGHPVHTDGRGWNALGITAAEFRHMARNIVIAAVHDCEHEIFETIRRGSGMLDLRADAIKSWPKYYDLVEEQNDSTFYDILGVEKDIWDSKLLRAAVEARGRVYDFENAVRSFSISDTVQKNILTILPTPLRTEFQRAGYTQATNSTTSWVQRAWQKLSFSPTI